MCSNCRDRGDWGVVDEKELFEMEFDMDTFVMVVPEHDDDKREAMLIFSFIVVQTGKDPAVYEVVDDNAVESLLHHCVVIVAERTIDNKGLDNANNDDDEDNEGLSEVVMVFANFFFFLSMLLFSFIVGRSCYCQRQQ